ncbi:MAG: tetratricopeptide repeat protein [Polyangiaceae bacterium]
MPKRAKPTKRNHPFAPYRLQDVPLFLQQAIELQQRGKVVDARAIYRRILATVPKQADALHFLGLIEHQLGHTERGLAFLDEAIALVPDHADFYNNRGNVHRQCGEFERAEADYRTVLRLRPTDAGALNNLGALLRTRGDLDGAVQHYRAALTLVPDHAEALRSLGSALSILGDYAEALAILRRALELCPTDTHVLRYVAGLCYATGRLDEAKRLYGEWHARDPEDPVARHMYAACTATQVPERASNEYVRSTFDDYATTFDQSLERLQYRAPALVTTALSRLLDSEGGSERIILDAGCGTGLCGSALRPLAGRLIGVDLSAQMLERARVRGTYDELVEAELGEYLALHPDAFDVVVSADTLVYFGRLEPIFAAVRTALRHGGRFVSTLEHSGSDSETDYRLHPHGRYSHRSNYVERALRAAGFATPTIEAVQLRKEAGSWVEGLLVCTSAE